MIGVEVKLRISKRAIWKPFWFYRHQYADAGTATFLCFDLGWFGAVVGFVGF
jgi:hypothetical protein